MPRPPADNVVYGVHPVMEAVASGRTVNKVYVARSKTSGAVGDILSAARGKGIPVQPCTREAIEDLCPGVNHQGIVAVVEPYAYADVEDILAARTRSGETGVILILDGIFDPVNLGSLVRTAAAWGVHGIIIPKDRSARMTPAAIRTSAGGAEYVPVAQVTNLSQTMDYLKTKGFWFYGADPAAAEELPSLSLDSHAGYVIGGEGQGIRPLVKRHCDVLFRIPTARPIPLNAAISGATILYEVMRQRRLKLLKSAEKQGKR